MPGRSLLAGSGPKFLSALAVSPAALQVQIAAQLVALVAEVSGPSTQVQIADGVAARSAEGDSTLVRAALGDIARAKGMTHIAREAGLGRESLYKALSPAGNPEFATILKVVAALDLQLHAGPVGVKSAG